MAWCLIEVAYGSSSKEANGRSGPKTCDRALRTGSAGGQVGCGVTRSSRQLGLEVDAPHEKISIVRSRLHCFLPFVPEATVLPPLFWISNRQASSHRTHRHRCR